MKRHPAAYTDIYVIAGIPSASSSYVHCESDDITPGAYNKKVITTGIDDMNITALTTSSRLPTIRAKGFEMQSKKIVEIP
jgi:hypothetical protein